MSNVIPFSRPAPPVVVDEASSITPEERLTRHKWVMSTLGHGEMMCSECRITNREAGALGQIDFCRGRSQAEEIGGAL